MDVTSVAATVDGDFEFAESLEIPLSSTLDLPEISEEICGNETDIELVKKSAQGNIAAFEQIYIRHNRRIYSICLRMMANPVEAEDMMQEVFIQLYRKIGSFRGDSQFTTWLHRLTVNQVLMYFRRKNVKIEKMTEDEDFPEQVILGTENPLKMQIVDKIAIDEAIEQLPTGYRTIFVLHDVEGFEHEEISKMLGLSVGTSKSQLHKARLKMRKLLQRKKL